MLLIEKESDKDLIRRLQELLRKTEVEMLRVNVKNRKLISGLNKIAEFNPDRACCDFEELKDMAADLIKRVE